MFQFRAFPPYTYLIQCTVLEYCSSGFPHSEISGSTDICSSPKLIAACHVLRRLLMPRHSPCALYSLTSSMRTSTLAKRFLVLLNYAGNLQIFAKLIVTHIFSDVPQLIQHFCDFSSQTLCCLAFITFPLFSFQGTNAGLFETRSQNTIPCVLRSNLNWFGGPEWARTTDLTIISRTL